MVKIVKLKTVEFSDAACVRGIQEGDSHIMEYFFIRCKKYFDEHYQGIFFVQEHDKNDIFQNTYIALWESIEYGKIYAKDGKVYGWNNEPFRSSLMTYMMGISKLKYKEWVRGRIREPFLNDMKADGEKQSKEPADNTFVCSHENEQLSMLEAISECLAVMPKGCYEILTKFYDEGKKLDEIMKEMPNYKSKNALKSNKNRCLESLRISSRRLYEKRRDL